MRDRDLVTIDPNELRAAVRAAVARLDLKTLVRAAVQEAAGRPAAPSPEYRQLHEHNERMRARQVAIETAWAQTYPISAGCPNGMARGVEMRHVEILGVPTWLPLVPGSARR